MKKLLLFIPLLFLSCGYDLEQDYCGALVVSNTWEWGDVELIVLKDTKYHTLKMPKYYEKYREGDTLCKLTKYEYVDSLRLSHNSSINKLEIEIREVELKIKKLLREKHEISK